MKKFLFFRILCVLAVLLSACGSQNTQDEIDGGIFFYDKTGAPLSGWQEIAGNRYYLQPNGQAVTGIHEIDGAHYCFGTDGIMATGWTELASKTYYLRSNGTMVTGWFSCDGQRYYLSPRGAATGIHTVDGNLYVFDQSGRLTSGWADLGSQLAYGDVNGHPLTGWQTIDGQQYYFKDAGILATGWTSIDGFDYYFYNDGTPAQGMITLDGQTYSFASTGQHLLLVNPWNFLPEGYTVELTQINDLHQIASIAYDDYLEMMTACENAGMQPAVCSSYRTQEYQEDLFARRVADYMEEGYSQAQAQELVRRSVAIPGTSEHQLGLAIDIVDNRNWNLDESQASMPTQQWLMENSWRYGWILRYPNEKSAITGIIYEPWHYRYVGREVAAEINDFGLCLEEYLMLLTPGIG